MFDRIPPIYQWERKEWNLCVSMEFYEKISYLNLLTIGYNFLEYVNFISRRFECLCALFGIIMMSLAINVAGRKK